MFGIRRLIITPCLSLFLFAGGGTGQAEEPTSSPSLAIPQLGQFLSDYCIDCHNSDDPTAGLDVDALASAPLATHWEPWEKVARKLRTRQMPPAESTRPDESEYIRMLGVLEQSL